MSRVKRLTVVLLLNLSLITALVIVGLAAHSLAVLAAGADLLADAGASQHDSSRGTADDQHRQALGPTGAFG